MGDSLKSVIRQRFLRNGTMVYNDWTQPSRGRILEENRARQSTMPRKSDWIRPMASIPELDREVLKQRNPELFQDRRKMEKFLSSSEGRKYRVTPKGRSRAWSFGGI